MRVPRVCFSRQEAVHLGLGVDAQLVSELRRRQAEDGLICGGAQVKVAAQRLQEQRGDDLCQAVLGSYAATAIKVLGLIETWAYRK